MAEIKVALPVNKIARDAYLLWSDFYAQKNWWASWPAYEHVDDKTKQFWAEFVQEIEHKLELEKKSR